MVRYELKVPFPELVVTGCQPEQTAAEPLRVRTATSMIFFVRAEVGVPVHKTPEAIAAVQNPDQVHGAEASGGEASTMNRFQVQLAFPSR